MRQSPLLLSILAALTSCSETFEDTGCFDVPAEQSLAESWPRLDVEELALRSNVDAQELYRAAEAGVSQVLRPAVAALLV